MHKIIPILHDIRSLHNVGSILRTTDGLGIEEVWVTGYTPYPKIDGDDRLMHIATRATNQIAKTALGAEENIKLRHFGNIEDALVLARNMNLQILALEQSVDATEIGKFVLNRDSVLILGNEVNGIDVEILKNIDKILEIQMFGKKNSFNVSVAAAIALFSLLRT